jgi:hypothetical protein
LFPQAHLSDNAAKQVSQKKIFWAGVSAGIAGGFVVEGLTRIRPVRRHRDDDKRQERTAGTHAPFSTGPELSGPD